MFKKLLQPKTIFIAFLLLIIIFLTTAKITSKRSTNQTGQNPVKNTSTPSLSINSNSNSSSPIPTIVNIGQTNSDGDPMFYESEEDSSSLIPTIDTSYVLPTISQEEGDDTDVDLDFPLAQILPYQGTYFRTTRYIGVNNLEIIVPRKDQTDLAKKEAQEWLVKNGADKYDRFTVVYK